MGWTIAGLAVTAYAAYSANEAKKDASERAAEAQIQGSRSAAEAQVYAVDRALEAQAPWLEAGERGLDTLESMLSRGPGKYTESPGYQFRLGEGEKGIERFASAKGGLLSGATGKALMRYGQDYATQDFDKFLARYYDSLKPYQSLAQVGQTSATKSADLMVEGGEAQAAGYLGVGKAQASNYLTQGQMTASNWGIAGQMGSGFLSAYANR
jgi:hypothetical protein